MVETERLLLRAWRQSDREPFRAMGRDEEVMRYLGPLTRAESDARIDSLMRMQAAHGHCFWAVERREDGRFLGFCGIHTPRAPIHEYEIGWRFARHAWGQGYAREAALAALDWTWANLATPSVMAVTNLANVRSWGLMERIGMVRMPGEDFDHPEVADDDPLRPHILYRIHRPR
jgi:RimJ/RimL family protein N-acetyltransferase